jgi:hypothetical protein
MPVRKRQETRGSDGRDARRPYRPEKGCPWHLCCSRCRDMAVGPLWRLFLAMHCSPASGTGWLLKGLSGDGWRCHDVTAAKALIGVDFVNPPVAHQRITAECVPGDDIEAVVKGTGRPVLKGPPSRQGPYDERSTDEGMITFHGGTSFTGRAFRCPFVALAGHDMSSTRGCLCRCVRHHAYQRYDVF